MAIESVAIELRHTRDWGNLRNNRNKAMAIHDSMSDAELQGSPKTARSVN